MESQTTSTEKEDDHIEDEGPPAGKVKDGNHTDDENLPAGKVEGSRGKIANM